MKPFDENLDVAICGDIYVGGENRPFFDEKVKSLLGSANVAIANLEAPILANGESFRPMKKHSTLASTNNIINAILDAKFTDVTLANNHFMDYGELAARNTMKLLSKAGIGFIGAGKNNKEAYAPLKKGNLWITSSTSVLVPDAASTDTSFGVASIEVRSYYGTSQLIPMEEPGSPYYIRCDISSESLKRLKPPRNNGISKIAIVHWGIGLKPYNTIVTPYQKELGHMLIDAGYDIVIGTHPHTVQDIEAYKGHLIMYGLGNFLFHPIMSGMEPIGTIFFSNPMDKEYGIAFITQNEYRVTLLDINSDPVKEKIDLFRKNLK
ncbi:MAG: CapA family protein, partial [Candidatus Parvarchaeota archaeon]